MSTRKQHKPDEEDDGKRAPEDAVASIVLTLGRKGPVTSDAELLERLKEGANAHPGYRCAAIVYDPRHLRTIFSSLPLTEVPQFLVRPLYRDVLLP
jgi:hypothetical protein